MELLKTYPILTEGTAENTPKFSFIEHQFTRVTNVLVQVHLTSVILNRQTNSFWKVNLNIDSYGLKVGDNIEVKTVPQFTNLNSLEIKKCKWIKVRLEAVNGHGAGFVNIYKL
jgi:type IV secretory pathway TrbF-like protein